MKKLVLISLDLLAALPILTMAFALLLSSVGGTQRFLLSLGESQTNELRAATASQVAASRIDTGAANYTVAESMADDVFAAYNVSSSVASVRDAQACGAQHALCRLVTVSGKAYLLVVSYESTG